MGSKGNFFFDKENFRNIDTFRIAYLILSVFFFILTEIGRFIYRPFIYENKIDDFGIADSIGNTGGIIVQIFFTLLVLNSPKTKAIRIIVFLVLGYIVYEIAQPFLPKGVFDWKDIYGTIAGGFLALLMLLLLHKLIKRNRVLFRF